MILEFFLFSSPITGKYILDHAIFSTVEPDNRISIGDEHYPILTHLDIRTATEIGIES